MAFQSFPMEFQIRALRSGVYVLDFSNDDFYRQTCVPCVTRMIECMGQAAEQNIRTMLPAEETEIRHFLLVGVKSFETITENEKKHRNACRFLLHIKEAARFGSYITSSIEAYAAKIPVYRCTIIHIMEGI